MTDSVQHDPLEELHQQALEQYNSGDTQAARQIWEAILQIDPEHEGALDGQRRTSLVGGNWSVFDESTPPDPVLSAGLARAEELLAAGRASEARGLVEELRRSHPESEAVQALYARLPQASVPQAAPAEAPPAGPPESAAPVAEALDEPGGLDLDLELDLDLALPSAAPAAAASASPPSPPSPVDAAPAEDPAAPAPDLSQAALDDEPFSTGGPAASFPGVEDLGLSLEASESGYAPPADARPPSLDEAPSMRDLLQAADDLHERETPEEFVPTGVPEADEAASGRAPEEALILVARGRDAIAAGDAKKASEYASRALAVSESTPGAEQLLEEARALEARRGDEAESLLGEAVSEYERGRPEVAVPLLRQVLEMVPGHPEAEQYLARAEQELGDLPENTSPTGLVGNAADDSQQTGFTGPAAVPPPMPEELSAAPWEGGGVATGADAPGSTGPFAPGDFTDESFEPPPPPPSEIVPPPPPAEAKTDKKRAKRPAKSGGGSRKGLVALLAVVLMGGGGYVALVQYDLLGLFSGGADEAPFDPQSPELIAARKAAQKARETQAQAAAQPGAPSAEAPDAIGGAGAGASAELPEPAAPAYTRADVPSLLAEAERAVADGDEERAVELLVAAQGADPVNFEVVERLEDARGRLRERQDSLERIAMAKEAFSNQSYAEALRIFYRIPKEHQPAEITRWIGNGWYNLGILALQANNVVEARRYFSDCLEAMPGDAEAARNLEVAKRYANRSRDDAYSMYVSSLSLRPIDN